MSKKIGVLDCHESVDAQPSNFIKKSIAEMHVRRLLADRIKPNLIRMRAIRSVDEILKAASFAPGRPAYIPEKMPPREVPGVFFELPKSDQWVIAHRTVSFMELS
jgi:hypothetical protein